MITGVLFDNSRERPYVYCGETFHWCSERIRNKLRKDHVLNQSTDDKLAPVELGVWKS